MCPNNMICEPVKENLGFSQITASKLSNVEQPALRGGKSKVEAQKGILYPRATRRKRGCVCVSV